MKTNKNLMATNNDLEEASNLQKKSKKKYIILIVIIFILLIMAGGVIFFLLKWSYSLAIEWLKNDIISNDWYSLNFELKILL